MSGQCTKISEEKPLGAIFLKLFSVLLKESLPLETVARRREIGPTREADESKQQYGWCLHSFYRGITFDF